MSTRRALALQGKNRVCTRPPVFIQLFMFIIIAVPFSQRGSRGKPWQNGYLSRTSNLGDHDGSVRCGFLIPSAELIVGTPVLFIRRLTNDLRLLSRPDRGDRELRTPLDEKVARHPLHVAAIGLAILLQAHFFLGYQVLVEKDASHDEEDQRQPGSDGNRAAQDHE